MRIFISCDIEGISGIVHIDQTWPSGQDYQRSRELMTAEANTAALGAFDAKANLVVINDSHGDMRNIIIEKLDSRVQLISGDLKPLSMVQGLEAKFDAAFFIGYHAGAGSQTGILDHTYAGRTIFEIKINGKIMNEVGINALVAGAFGTPVVLVTGDEQVCKESKELLGNVETVVVKWGISRYAARSLHPIEAQKMIREAAKKALRSISRFKPLKFKSPYNLQIKMTNCGAADSAEIVPEVKRIDALTLEFNSKDIVKMYKALLTLTILGAQSTPQVRPK